MIALTISTCKSRILYYLFVWKKDKLLGASLMQVKRIITMMHVRVPFSLPVFVSIYMYPLVDE